VRAWWVAFALSGPAFAQDAVDGVEAAASDDDVYEVRVYGPGAVAEARRQIVREMEGLGWHLVEQDGGDSIFRGDRGWMGRAILTKEGLLDFTAPSLLAQGGSPEAVRAARGPSAQKLLAFDAARAAEFPGADSPTDEAEAGSPNDVEVPTVTFSTGASGAKRDGVRDDVVVGIDAALLHYREVVQETAFQDTLAELDQRLDALWELGVPLEGGPKLPDIAARRADALHHWATRADTPHGQRTCEAIERWLVTTVQTSAPVTPEEAAAAELTAKGTHGRLLPTH